MNELFMAAMAGYLLINLFVLWWYVRAKRKAKCQHAVTVRFTSINKKWCSDCGAWLTWELKPGQKPLF